MLAGGGSKYKGQHKRKHKIRSRQDRQESSQLRSIGGMLEKKDSEKEI